MKFECITSKLRQAITQTEKAVSKNISLPILNNIGFFIEPKKLVIKATNLEIGVEITLPIKADDNREFAINPTVFSQTLSNYQKNDKIEFEESNGNLVVKGEKTKTVIKCSPADDFPSIPQVSQKTFTIDNELFIKGVRNVLYAASISDIKPEISSVYIYQNQDELVFVATDGFRLSEYKIAYQVEGFTGVIVPIKNIIEVIKILELEKGNLDVFVEDNQIGFKIDNLLVVSRLINGVFPDYKQIMPKSFSSQLTLKVSELKEALRLIAVTADKYFKVTLNVDSSGLQLTSSNQDVGNSDSFVAPVLFSGEPVSVSISLRSLTDVFQSLSNQNVVIGFNGPTKPICLSCPDNPNFKALIMILNR